MKFFVDNNLSYGLASGMREFGEDVDHLRDYFPEDTPDVKWLEYIGKKGFCLVTRDEGIRRNPAERQALRRFRIGSFFLGGKNRTRWQLVEQLVRNWRRMNEFAGRERRPFAFRIPPRGTRFEKIPLS